MTRSANTSRSLSATAALFLRYAGSDKPAAQVAARARQRADLPLTWIGDGAAVASAPEIAGADYTLIDTTLEVDAAADGGNAAVPLPAPGLAYAGFTPQQRAAYHAWLEHPAQPAPPAFQQLLLANAEVRLLEDGRAADAAYAALRLLPAAPAWHGHPALARTLLFAFWLRQDGAALAQWSAAHQLPPPLWSPVLGCQALLRTPLQPDQLPGLASAWDLPVPHVAPAVLRLRLDTLQATLGAEPLAHALSQLDETARAPQPWRCQHRDLRLAFPQPDVRRHLARLLADLLAVVDTDTAGASPTEFQADPEGPAAVEPAPAKRGPKSKKEAPPPSPLEQAHIIVEFGASRSDVFGYVLRQAQKQPGFQQIMDENRHIVYRVPYRRSEMRRFWHLWQYIQGWASTRVYCQGKQLDKWQIYPYSQYML